VTWAQQAEAAIERYRGGETRDLDQRQLTQLANAAWAAGLALLMDGRHEEASDWLCRAAHRYRESWDAGAPADSWGRPIAAIKALLLAGGDASGAARWALEAGAAEAESPIGRYAATLALLVLGRDFEARVLADEIRTHEGFPREVGDALACIAAQEVLGYVEAVEAVLESFETRDEYLEDIPVADTVLVLQALAARRGPAADLSSELLPG
jgi:hypothetical protein